ncbi:7877_t:CDS:2, partial [Racocetra fulgida]
HIAVQPPSDATASEANAAMEVEEEKKGVNDVVIEKLNETSANSGITCLDIDQTENLILTGGNDKKAQIFNRERNKTEKTVQTLAKVESNEVNDDGLILGTGTNDSVVRIWDVKSQQNVASFTGHTGRVTSISFSENGYFLATASEDNLVKLWDLRKLSNFHTLTIDEGKINKVVWDYSGHYLAVGGTDMRIYQSKTWNELVVMSENTAEITDMKFGELAKYLVVGGLDP